MRILVALLACAMSFSLWAGDASKEDITSCHIDKHVRTYLKGPRGHKGKKGAQGAPGSPLQITVGDVGGLFVEAIFIDLSTQGVYSYAPLTQTDWPTPNGLNPDPVTHVSTLPLTFTVIDPALNTITGTVLPTNVTDAQGATIYTWRFQIPQQRPVTQRYLVGYYKVLINLFTPGAGAFWRTTPDVVRIVRENPVGASGQELTRWIEKEALEAREKTLHTLCVNQGLLNQGPPPVFSSANTPNKGVSLLKNYSEHTFYLGFSRLFFRGTT